MENQSHALLSVHCKREARNELACNYFFPSAILVYYMLLSFIKRLEEKNR